MKKIDYFYIFLKNVKMQEDTVFVKINNIIFFTDAIRILDCFRNTPTFLPTHKDGNMSILKLPITVSENTTRIFRCWLYGQDVPREYLSLENILQLDNLLKKLNISEDEMYLNIKKSIKN